ncbi:hypothetical protein CAEBREN_25003 [Caenorhabditis brenneri]|uniref:Serpentine Receptor, class J n=1 Tax=Caenorhabditis brenneri TaxID=135651 RepID=G0PLJ7_CAEBE|nr:hypothetical protein CAEBREN_25003 [Caenorhabditis brenneri]
MYINWAHYTIPKVSFVLSFISNPLFIYLIYTNKKVLFGSYRYLLAFFAIFNLFASVADLLIPVISQYGEYPLSYRCSFIAGTYGILNVHFVFRYLTLKNNHFLNQYFMPYGLVFSVIYVIFHMIIWGLIDFHCLHSAPEIRDYIRVPFKELFNESIDDINFVAGLFWIITGLNIESITMSKQTAQMQKQLFKALAIQTIIPICVSFMPCSLSFYGAALRWDFMNWVYWTSAVAVSMFPFLDPMAIIFFLPALRRRIWDSMGKKRNEVSMVTNQYSEGASYAI